MYLTEQLSVEDLYTHGEAGRQMGVEFMKQSNQTVNDILRDGEYACGAASGNL